MQQQFHIIKIGKRKWGVFALGVCIKTGTFGECFDFVNKGRG